MWVVWTVHYGHCRCCTDSKVLRLHHGSYRVKVRQGRHVEEVCLPRVLCADSRARQVPGQASL